MSTRSFRAAAAATAAGLALAGTGAYAATAAGDTPSYPGATSSASATGGAATTQAVPSTKPRADRTANAPQTRGLGWSAPLAARSQHLARAPQATEPGHGRTATAAQRAMPRWLAGPDNHMGRPIVAGA